MEASGVTNSQQRSGGSSHPSPIVKAQGESSTCHLLLLYVSLHSPGGRQFLLQTLAGSQEPISVLVFLMLLYSVVWTMHYI